MPRKLRQRSLKLCRIGQKPPFWLEGTLEEPAVSREEFDTRLQSEPILNILFRFQEHGGDAERLRFALSGLNPVYVILPPPPRILRATLKRCIASLEKVLELPGPLLFRKVAAKALQDMQFFLNSPADYKAYFEYWKPPQQEHFANPWEMALLTMGNPPPVYAESKGRQKGSSVNLVLAAITREFRLRFGQPRYEEILILAKAVAPELFPTSANVRHIQDRIWRVPFLEVKNLHRSLFLQ